MKLEEYLYQKKMSYRKFAILAGVSHRTLYVYLNGQRKRRIHRLTAYKIVKATDGEVPMQEFGYQN